MPSYLFLRGLAIGFALAAPVGPVGVLCVRRALADGRYAAFIAGLGAAFADTFYGAVAGLGLTVVSSFLATHHIFLRVTGGLILIILGVRSLRMAAPFEADPAANPGLLKDFLSTFLITLTNPGTILASMGVFAAFGAFGQGEIGPAAALLILGIFSGSTLWWLILSSAASAMRARLPPSTLALLNRGSGILLMLFGVAIMASLAFSAL